MLQLTLWRWRPDVPPTAEVGTSLPAWPKATQAKIFFCQNNIKVVAPEQAASLVARRRLFRHPQKFSSTRKFLWSRGDLNSRPPRCERDALPTELLPQIYLNSDPSTRSFHSLVVQPSSPFLRTIPAGVKKLRMVRRVASKAQGRVAPPPQKSLMRRRYWKDALRNCALEFMTTSGFVRLMADPGIALAASTIVIQSFEAVRVNWVILSDNVVYVEVEAAFG